MEMDDEFMDSFYGRNPLYWLAKKHRKEREESLDEFCQYLGITFGEGQSFDELKKSFELKYSQSLDKETLLKTETEGYELFFDEDKLPLSKSELKNNSPLSERYYIYFPDWEIYYIRKAYGTNILRGYDIIDESIWSIEMNAYLSKEYRGYLTVEPSFIYNQALVILKYIQWLKSLKPRDKKPAAKYYAWYHKIMIVLGKEAPFTPGAKQEIIKYGKKKYTTSSGFYQAFIEFDTDKKQLFVTSLSPKERKDWKAIIIEISGNDADVIEYLNKFPN